MNTVANVGPVSVFVDATNWHAYDGGIFDGCDQANPNLNHVVVIVGYGEENGLKYWVIRNSWSASWGEAGYMRIKRSSEDEENCGVDTYNTEIPDCGEAQRHRTACGTCGIISDSSYPVINVSSVKHFSSFL